MLNVSPRVGRACINLANSWGRVDTRSPVVCVRGVDSLRAAMQERAVLRVTGGDPNVWTNTFTHP